MKRVAYAEAVVGLDVPIAERILDYATRLAAIGSADTVVVPAVVGDGPVQPVSMLLGPASQITMWEDGTPFPVPTDEAVADLDRRIAGLSTSIQASDDAGPVGLDDFDDPQVALPDE